MAGYAEQSLVRGLSFLAEKQASIANNLANVDTASFKRRAAIAQPTGDRFYSLLERNLSAVDYREVADMSKGTLRETGNRFDIALDGPHWLRVANDAGKQFYTRNGQLTIATDGTLTTRSGLKVLNRDGQPLRIGSGADTPSDIAFSPNGTVTNPATGQTYGTLAMVELPEPEALVPVGSSLYIDPKGQQGTQVGTGLQQGFLEGSNVDSLQELVAMIAVERSFSATQKALSGVNQLQENLITNMLR